MTYNMSPTKMSTTSDRVVIMKKIAWYFTALLWQMVFLPIAFLIVVSVFFEFFNKLLDAITKPLNDYFLALMNKRENKWWG